MSALASFPFDEIAARGNIREADTEQLRQAIYSDGLISAEEAERLIALNSTCPVHASAWHEVFQDALTDFVVNQVTPKGYVTQENAEWLISSIAPDGLVKSRKDLDIVVHIIDTARWSPEILIAFALSQIGHAVRSGHGPLNSFGDAAVISDEDVELVRRMIYAFGGDGNVAVTRSEAEMLCDINDSLDPENLNEAWTELYVKAMANFLLANSGYSVPAREEALKTEAWVEERGELSPLELIASITKLSLDDVLQAYRKQSREECAMARLDRQYRELVTDQALTRDESEWLAARLARDGRLTPAEIALMAYLKETAIDIDPRFEELLDRHLTAA